MLDAEPELAQAFVDQPELTISERDVDFIVGTDAEGISVKFSQAMNAMTMEQRGAVLAHLQAAGNGDHSKPDIPTVAVASLTLIANAAIFVAVVAIALAVLAVAGEGGGGGGGGGGVIDPVEDSHKRKESLRALAPGRVKLTQAFVQSELHVELTKLRLSEDRQRALMAFAYNELNKNGAVASQERGGKTRIRYRYSGLNFEFDAVAQDEHMLITRGSVIQEASGITQ